MVPLNRAAAITRWANGFSFPQDDVDAGCRARVRALGEAGFLTPVAAAEYLHSSLDVRTLCLAREILAAHDALLDFAFAMQGLGSVPISLFGTPALQRRYLPDVMAGKSIAAFALSEPDAGSDVAALTTRAVPDGPAHVRIDGTKTWVSNGGIADHYVMFARTGEGNGAKGLSAFVVDADTPGLRLAERIEVIAPHPLARIEFRNCRLPADALLGSEGEGFKLAMRTLDIFRASVAAAASVPEALDFIEKRRPNVIVTDIAMPGTDGYDLIRTIRQALATMRVHRLWAGLTMFGIVWGTASDGDNIVWGTADGDNIVWGTYDGDNIVWGTAGQVSSVWVSAPDGTRTQLSGAQAFDKLKDRTLLSLLQYVPPSTELPELIPPPPPPPPVVTTVTTVTTTTNALLHTKTTVTRVTTTTTDSVTGLSTVSVTTTTVIKNTITGATTTTTVTV
jgi:alkylation response protein AidB-like acyl-CoA dehydrogenase